MYIFQICKDKLNFDFFRPLSFKTCFRNMLSKHAFKIHCSKMFYQSMSRTFSNFILKVEANEFNERDIVLIKGHHGLGKTTFLRLLHGTIKPDRENSSPHLETSYKPQKILPILNDKTVEELLQHKIPHKLADPQFTNQVMNQLQIDALMEKNIQSLSTSDVQRLAICMTLGKKANLYLFDEPFKYMDDRFQIIIANVIQNFMNENKKIAMIVENDPNNKFHLSNRTLHVVGEPFVHGSIT